MQTGGRRRPTLADVARATNTTPSTVSKVLRGGTDVARSTRESVMAAVAELGYALPQGREPAGVEPPLIDFVVSDMHGSWVHQALGGVEGEATAADHDVVMTIARADGGWLKRVLRRRSAGVVIALVDAKPAELDLLRARGRPFVLIDPMSPPPSFAASVGVTNREGGRTAAEHLLTLGHRSLGMIGGHASHRYGQERLEGFRDCVSAAGLSPAIPTAYGEWQREDGRAAAHRLLTAPDRPTALFCCADVMALGAYDVAASLGLRIPDDLSVVGFDDLPEATWATPQLTSVRQPLAELGAAAVRLLLRLGAGQGPDAAREQLATSLIVRASTAPPH